MKDYDILRVLLEQANRRRLTLSQELNMNINRLLRNANESRAMYEGSDDEISRQRIRRINKDLNDDLFLTQMDFIEQMKKVDETLNEKLKELGFMPETVSENCVDLPTLPFEEFINRK